MSKVHKYPLPIALILTVSLLAGCDMSPTASGSPIRTPLRPKTQVSPPTTLPTAYSPIPPDSLYPISPVNWEAFTHYPGMSYPEIFDQNPEIFLLLDFDTNDSAEEVEAFYKDLALKSGWRQGAPTKGWRTLPRYYLGDYGQRHVYGYYLSFWTVKGNYLKTYARVEIERTLPVYLGAMNVDMDEYQWFDSGSESVEFDTTDGPDLVREFYKGLLARDNWQVTSPGSQLVWSLVSGAAGPRSSICYGIMLEVTRQNLGNTHAKLSCRS